MVCMTLEHLISQLGHAAGKAVPQAAFRARVKLRVLEAIEAPRAKRSWMPIFLRAFSGSLAVLTLVTATSFFVYRGAPTQASYIGEVELVAGGGLEIVRTEEGKEPVTESIGQHTEVKTVKIRAGDIIRTSSGSTIALRFDNHSSATISDEAILTVGGVTAKNAKDEPTTVAVVLEKGRIETVSQGSDKEKDAVLEVQTASKTIEASNVAVAVSVEENGETNIAAVYPDDPRIRTLNLGSRVIIGADLSMENENSNGSSPTPTPTYVWTPQPAPTSTPSPSPSPIGTGSGSTVEKGDTIDIVIPIRLR